MKKKIFGVLFCLCMVMALLPATALAADPHTNHCICGASHKTVGDHNAAVTPSWNAVNGTGTSGKIINADLNAITAGSAGNHNYYYLTADVELSETWTPANYIVLCLNGHTIKAMGSFDAITVSAETTFTLTNCEETGTITHSSGTGRGVYVNGGNFIMYGGTISGNTFTSTGFGNGGGGVAVNGGTFTMNGGTISGNKVTGTNNYGGGVFSTGSSTFTMNGGKISDNEATGDSGCGGGVSASNFYMYGGEISSNSGTGSNSRGGGVYSDGPLYLYSGSITENDATGNGGGVYAAGNTFRVSGAPVVSNNTKGGTDANNVYRLKIDNNNSKVITIFDALAEDAQIGITLETSEGVFTTGWGSKMPGVTDADIVKYFTPDDPSKFEIKKNESNELEVKRLHAHGNWNYSYDSETKIITATCGNTPCPLSDVTYSINVADNTPYSSSYTCPVTLGTASGTWTAAGLATPTITDNRLNSELTAGNDVPTGTATLTVGGSAVTDGTVTYTLLKGTLTPTDFTFTAPTEPTYDGNAKVAAVTPKSGVEHVGLMTVNYYKGETLLESAPKDVGTYTVKINIPANTYYDAVSDLTSSARKFTIEKNTTITAAPNCEFSFDGPNAGKLMGSTTDMQYSLYSNSGWTDCTEADMLLPVEQITTTHGIWVNVKETDNQVASYVQSIVITAGGDAPNADKTDCPKNGTGSLTGVNNAMEYKMGSEGAWTSITGDTTTVTGLGAGTYYVRYKATGHKLPSEAKELTIAPYVAKSDKAITSFKIGDVDGTINESAHTIAVTVPYGTTVTALAPTIEVSALATVSPASGVPTDFTSLVTYTVTAENGTTQAYTVTVPVAPPKLNSVTPPSEQTLTDFHTTADSAKTELPTTVTITSQSDATTLPCTWSCDSYNQAPGETNTFHWEATTTGFDVNGQTVTGDVTITNRAAIQLTISAPTLSAAEKTYDGATTVDGTVTAGTLSGVLSGDTVITSAASAVYDSKDAGNRTITVSYAISGTDAWKYLAPVASAVSGKINPKSVTLTGGISAPEQPYNGQNTVTLTKGTLSFTGLVNPETLDVSIPATGTITNVNVGTGKPVTYSVTLADGANGGLAANYTLSDPLPDVTVNITKATYTGTKTASDSVFSGQTTTNKTLTLPALPEGASYAASGTVGGTTALISGHSVTDSTLTYSTSNQSDGTSATITIGVTNATNYNDYEVVVTISASAKENAGVAFGTIPTSKTYGNADYEVSASVANAGTNGEWTWTSSDETVMTVTKNAENGAKAAVHIVKAGSATITATYESDTTKGTVTSGTITVNKATITVTANNQSIYVNDSAPDLSSPVLGTHYTVTGLVGEDTLGGTIAMKYQKNSSDADPDVTTPGTYDIVISGAEAPDDNNYDISYVSGTLTISARPYTGGDYTPPTYKVESEVSKDADGNVSFSTGSAKKGDTVTITVTPDRYYKVDGVTVKDSSGKTIAVTDNGDGTFTFQMPASKVTVEPIFSWDNPFADVAEDAYYAPAVEWALKNDVTNGAGDDTTFAPNAECTRAQIVTFLWQAAGCPEPTGANSFTDVSADAYYAKAVAWAVEQGITDGTGGGKFSPDEICTRSQGVTFLYRAAGFPEVSDNIVFSDVATGSYYAGAVVWAAQNGVTNGTGNGKFSPSADCSRAQIMTFLYRWMVK